MNATNMGTKKFPFLSVLVSVVVRDTAAVKEGERERRRGVEVNRHVMK